MTIWIHNHLHGGCLECGWALRAGEEGGKRKREGDEMEALEAQVTGTNLPGFVSAGIVQPDQRAAQAGTAAADASAAPGALARLLGLKPFYPDCIYVLLGQGGHPSFIVRCFSETTQSCALLEVSCLALGLLHLALFGKHISYQVDWYLLKDHSIRVTFAWDISSSCTASANS